MSHLYASAPVQPRHSGLGSLGWSRGNGIQVPGNPEQTEWIWDAAIAAADDLRRLAAGTPPAGCNGSKWRCRQRSALVRIFWGADWSRNAAAARAWREGHLDTTLIEALQEAMGVAVDGDWGPGTNAALELWIFEELPGFIEGRGAGGGGQRRRTPRREPVVVDDGPAPTPTPQPSTAGAATSVGAMALIGLGVAWLYYDTLA